MKTALNRSHRLAVWCTLFWACCLVSTSAQFCSTGVGGPLNLTSGPHTIDTDAGTVDGTPSPAFDGAYFNFTDITIQAGAVLTASGVQPLVLLAAGNVVIDGTIDASGQNGQDNVLCAISPGALGGTGGPGGGDGGQGGNQAVSGQTGIGSGGGTGGVYDPGCGAGSGAGGAGHITAGQPGNSGCGATPAAGGPTYVSSPGGEGGSGGGGGSGDATGYDSPGAGGGGGGGSVVVAATGTLTVGANGTIDVSGGNGGSDQGCGGCSGPGGGGSGGRIDLLAQAAMPVNNGTLNVSGGNPGANPFGCGEIAGGGGNGEATLNTQSCIPPPSCTTSTPASPATGEIQLDLQVDSPNGPSVDVSMDYSTDGGATYTPCTATATSPLPNPAAGVPLGPAIFIWDSRTDGVGLAALEPGVLVRTSVSDGVAPGVAICETSPFDVDNTQICTSFCGDCNLDASGPSIIDALQAAQIAAGLVTPTLPQTGCCDADASGAVTVLDALLMAQDSAGIAVTLVCL